MIELWMVNAISNNISLIVWRSGSFVVEAEKQDKLRIWYK